MAGSAATILTGNVKYAYASVALPLVALLAGIQKGQAAKETQEELLERLAVAVEDTYAEKR